MQLRLKQGGANIQIAPQVVEATAQRLDGTITRLLLERRGADVEIT
jgi:hypothetical protein